MKLMQLIKLVLDDAYNEIQAANDDEKDALIKAELEALSAEYKKLGNPEAPAIKYSDAIKRFAYIYKYTVAHADYIMQLVRGEKAIRELLQKGNPKVACLGGGPGSDLLGILKYMINSGVKDTALTCFIFDKERAWGESWSDVARVLDAPFSVYPSFMQMDVTDATTWKSYGKIAQADLFTLSYFMSEVWRLKDQAEPFFVHCMSQMKTGALLLFIDNNSPRFVEWFDGLAKQHDFEWILSKSSQMAFENIEEKTDLGIYLKKFGWILKRESNVAYRILRKK
jgi:hypothetical protein